MRLLQVIPSLAMRTGGPAITVVEASLALQSAGVETSIYATDMGEPASGRARNTVRPADLPSGADRLDIRFFRARAPRRIASSPSLYRTLCADTAKFDLLHIHSLFLFPQFAAYRQAVRLNLPYVVSPHGSLDPYLRRRHRAIKRVADALWQRRMLQQAALLHYATTAEARLVGELRLRPPQVVVPHGISWSRYQDLPDPRVFRRRHLDGHVGPIVMNMGRLSHKKGLDVLVQAFALVASDIPDSVLVIAGPDDEGLRPRLEDLASAYGVAPRTFFTGLLAGEDKQAALAAADVWALPSHTENFGIAVIEALAAGIPTLVSPAVNTADDIAKAAAGVVCPPTPEALASEIVILLQDNARRADLGRRGRALARRYDWSSVVNELVDMYEQALVDARR